MKKDIKLTTGIFALCFIALLSCTKSSSTSPAASPSALIVGTWNETKYYDDANRNGIMDADEAVASSELVDKYNADSTVVETDNGVTKTFFWELAYNNTYIKFSGFNSSGGGVQYCYITTLTSTSFTYEDTTGSGIFIGGAPLTDIRWYCYTKQ